MTPDDRAELRRKADRECLRRWRRAHRLEEALRAVRQAEARQTARILKEMRA